jgi:hypothetical protein
LGLAESSFRIFLPNRAASKIRSRTNPLQGRVSDEGQRRRSGSNQTRFGVAMEPPPDVEKIDVPFRTQAEIDDMVAQFEKCQWPYARWTHRAHLAVAVTYLQRYAFDEALRLLRQNIQQYNRTCGDPHGYHETITVVFMRLVDRFLDGRTRDGDSAALVAQLAEQYGMSTLFTYYSPGRLWSPEARVSWVEPDRKPLECTAE